MTAYREPLPTRTAGTLEQTAPAARNGCSGLVADCGCGLVAGLVLLGQAAARTEQQRLRAEASSRMARRAVDDYLVQVSQNTLLKSPGLQPLRKQLLESALKYYQEFVQKGGNDPELHAELAKAYFHVGNITKEVGDPKDALNAFLRAQDLYGRSPRLTHRTSLTVASWPGRTELPES